MNVYKYKNGFNYKSNIKTNLCLGLFDGVHLGHQFLIKQAILDNPNTSVFTFDGNVKKLINKKKDSYQLTSLKDKLNIFKNLGIKNVFILEFNNKTISITKENFIKDYLEDLNINKVFIGQDFTFGYKGEGNYLTLEKHFNTKVIDFISFNNQKISSSNIINLILSGQIDQANSQLGRYYSIKGKIIHGLANGRKINFPTANLKLSFNYPIPKNGVYASLIKINNKLYSSMSNIGTHPTIDELNAPLVETNIFDFNQDIYGKYVEVFFINKIREEQKFNSLDELKDQLSKDKDSIKNLIRNKI